MRSSPHGTKSTTLRQFAANPNRNISLTKVSLPASNSARRKMELRCFCGAVFATASALQQHADSRGHHYMCSCGRLFKNEASVRCHGRDFGSGHPKLGYTKHPSLGEDKKAATKASTFFEGYNCNLCERKYKSPDSVEAHQRDKHSTCPTCRQAFGTASQLQGHQKAAGHCYCHDHKLAFPCDGNLQVHLRKELHVTLFKCLICDKKFKTQQGLDDHVNDTKHPETVHTSAPSSKAEQTRIAIEETNLHCEMCAKNFKTVESLRMHKASVKHHPLSELRCPLDAGCGKTFTSPSALIFHLESGGCKSGMNRLQLNATVHTHDTARHITHEKNVGGALAAAMSVASLTSGMSSMSVVSSSEAIATPDKSDDLSISGDSDFSSDTITAARNDDDIISIASSDDDGSEILTPTATGSRSRTSPIGGGVILTPPSTSQAKSEWSYINGSKIFTPPGTSAALSTTGVVALVGDDGKWPCAICPRTFREKEHLLDHINSPVHAARIFHCPVGILGLHASGKGEKGFKTLSGLAQHIEVGACAGGKGMLDVIVGMFEQKVKEATGKEVKLLRAGGEASGRCGRA